MIVEHALVHVRAGEEESFEHSMTQAQNVIESAPGCYGAEVRQQIEDPSWYLLVVRWASVESHMEFRRGPLFERWRELTHHFYDVVPQVTHFNEPLAR